MKSFLLQPLSTIYKAVTDVRNRLYEQGRLQVHQLPIPIVSVGNLTMGGTGKTPILCELLQWANEQKLRPAMVSRGYKGSFTGIQRVPLNGDPELFGDEPVMVANKFPSVPVYVGTDRVAAVESILANEKIDLVFADDAFQHRRLGRNLDILILDCSEKIENYRVLPWGRGREDSHAVQRADFIILNKANLVSPEFKKKVLDFIEQQLMGKSTPVIESDYYLGHLEHLQTRQKQDIVAYESVLLVSAIGNPSAFEGLMRNKFNVVKHLIYRDHHKFTQHDIDVILNHAKNKNVQRIIVTEKDAVKLRRFSHLDFSVAVLAPKLSLQAKKIYERILETVR